MATYKVLQDIEAEDKLLGPLTLRQFIYAAVVIGLGGAAYLLSKVSPLLIIPFIPPMLLFGLLAAPFGKDQSSEVWLLAKIQFALKPQRRIWDQSGLKELVTITVPKKIEHQLTNGLSQTEVKSRLQALANTIDSRGWAVKNVNVNLFAQPSYALNQVGSDRLLDPTTLGQDVPNYDTQAIVDVLDETTSATAQKFDQLINTTQQTKREQLMAKMRSPSTETKTPANYWFMNQTPQPTDPGQAVFTPPPIVSPGTTDSSLVNNDTTYAQVSQEDEQALLAKIHNEQDRPDPGKSHLRTIDPLGSKKHSSKKTGHTKKQSPAPVTTPTDPAILEFAKRDDLNIDTIARQVNKKRPDATDGEVVISLR